MESTRKHPAAEWVAIRFPPGLGSHPTAATAGQQTESTDPKPLNRFK